jgi:hypothetical protein
MDTFLQARENTRNISHTQMVYVRKREMPGISQMKQVEYSRMSYHMYVNNGHYMDETSNPLSSRGQIGQALVWFHLWTRHAIWLLRWKIINEHKRLTKLRTCKGRRRNRAKQWPSIRRKIRQSTGKLHAELALSP